MYHELSSHVRCGFCLFVVGGILGMRPILQPNYHENISNKKKRVMHIYLYMAKTYNLQRDYFNTAANSGIHSVSMLVSLFKLLIIILRETHSELAV